MCMIESLIEKLLTMSVLSCTILMRVLLRLSLCVEILIMGNIRRFLRNQESP
jgi:hypothetical protein